MRLKVGDILYLKDSSSKHADTPFPIVYIRSKTLYDGDDICIIWIDGGKWWWGQIGESEPWTKAFISQEEYMRNRKLNEILQ